jgi:putative inorganic carbon (HCO3(-)) transporter
MFILLIAVISYTLATFGAVLPSNWFLLVIIWSLGIAGWLVWQAFRGRSWHVMFLVLLFSAAVMFWFLQPLWSTAIVAGIWAWHATARNNQQGVIRFLKVLLVIGLFEALLGLAQFFVMPGWIFGYLSPVSRSSGTLINRNHFAGLMEMFIPIALGLAYISAHRFGELARAYTYLLVGALMSLALLFSVSRMGILSFLFTLCFLGILQWHKSRRSLAAGLALGMGALVAVGALWIGVDSVVQRYSELMVGDGFFRQSRVMIFRDVTRMIAANPLGIGVDNFHDRFREYQTFHPDLLFDHAHNDYLETAAEWGLPVAMAFWSFIVFTAARAVRLFVSVQSPEQQGILLACIGAILAILVHSLMDFNLQIPSNAMLFFTFVGISLAMPLPESVHPFE